MSKGFTLVELLLLIVIIGVIFAIGISSFQFRTGNLKADKASVQMEQLLQAGVAYFRDNNAFPVRPTCTNPNPDSFLPYIPIEGDINPWGTCYSYQPTADQQSFIVQTANVPESAAARISTRLPNTIMQCNGNNTCTVIATTPTPAQTNSMLIQIVKTVTDLNDAAQVETDQFACPANWQPNATTIIRDIKPYDVVVGSMDKFCNFYLLSLLISAVHTFSPYCVSQSAPNTYKCYFPIESLAFRPTSVLCRRSDYTAQNLGKVSITYIGYCIPPGTQKR